MKIMSVRVTTAKRGCLLQLLTNKAIDYRLWLLILITLLADNPIKLLWFYDRGSEYS